MFSVTIALIAITGIAITNLFLGFASAMLLGRGPKNWSDLDDAVSVRYFSPRLVLPGARRAAPTNPTVDARTAPAVVTPPQRAPVEEEAPAPVATSTLHPAAPPASPAGCAAWDTTTRKLVLPPKASSAPPQEELEPEAVFARQFETWRASQPHEETPCLSGIMVTVLEPGLDDATRTRLMNAVHSSIVGQLRKDRRVLRISDHQFLWFSPDVPPDEGLAPVERTRQMLQKTRYLLDDAPLPVNVQAALLAVTADDNPADLLQRLRQTWQYALEKGDGPTCADVGRGPAFVQPPKLDLDEIDCPL